MFTPIHFRSYTAQPHATALRSLNYVCVHPQNVRQQKEQSSGNCFHWYQVRTFTHRPLDHASLVLGAGMCWQLTTDVWPLTILRGKCKTYSGSSRVPLRRSRYKWPIFKEDLFTPLLTGGCSNSMEHGLCRPLWRFWCTETMPGLWGTLWSPQPYSRPEGPSSLSIQVTSGAFFHWGKALFSLNIFSKTQIFELPLKLIFFLSFSWFILLKSHARTLRQIISSCFLCVN